MPWPLAAWKAIASPPTASPAAGRTSERLRRATTLAQSAEPHAPRRSARRRRSRSSSRSRTAVGWLKLGSGQRPRGRRRWCSAPDSEPIPIETSEPIAGGQQAGEEDERQLVGPSRPIASIRITAAMIGELKIIAIAAKLPAAAITVSICGGRRGEPGGREDASPRPARSAEPPARAPGRSRSSRRRRGECRAARSAAPAGRRSTGPSPGRDRPRRAGGRSPARPAGRRFRARPGRARTAGRGRSRGLRGGR